MSSPTSQPDDSLSTSNKRPKPFVCDRALLTAAGLLVLGIAIVYGKPITFGFVNWDDPWYVTNNALIHSWSFENLYGIGTETVTRNYAPLTIFSYLLDYTAWGEWAGGYHLTNLCWHALNSVLVFVLLRQLTGRVYVALAVALLFALHPVQIESVVWISARKGLISTSFILASLCFWLRENRTSQDELIGTGLFLVALFAKAIAVVLPAVVLLYDWLIRRKSFDESLGRQVVGFLLAIWFTLLTTGSQKIVGGGIRHHFALNKIEILGLDSVLLWRYLGMLLSPVERSIMYDPPLDYPLWIVLPSAIFWTGLAVWLFRSRHTHSWLVFGFAAALLPLLPVLNLIPLTTIINDRYLYLPCIPLFALGVIGVDWACRRIPCVPAAAMNTVLASLAIAACGWLTQQQMTMWKSDAALWKQAAEVSPELPIVQYQYALSLWNAGDESKAVDRLEYALSLPRVDEYDRERYLAKLEEFRSTGNESRERTAGLENATR